MNCQIKQGNINKEDTEVLVLGSYEDDKTLPKNFQVLDKALGGQLQELRKSGEFIGKNQQSVLIHTRGIVPAKRDTVRIALLLNGIPLFKRTAHAPTTRQDFSIKIARAFSVQF